MNCEGLSKLDLHNFLKGYIQYWWKINRVILLFLFNSDEFLFYTSTLLLNPFMVKFIYLSLQLNLIKIYYAHDSVIDMELGV